jgi:hypothetical protein
LRLIAGRWILNAMGTEAVELRRAGTKNLPGIMRLQLESYR